MKPTLKKTRAEIIKEEFAILQTEPTSKTEDISEKLMKRVRMNSEKMRRALLKNGLLRLHAALKNQHAPVLHQVLLQAANECTCLTKEYEKNQTMLKRLRIRNVQLKKVLEIKMIEYGVTSPVSHLGAGEPYPPDPLSMSTPMEKNQQKPSRRKKQVFRNIKEEMDPTSLIASAAEYLARIAEE
uniref:Uncharacterized protein n=1 Tax=Ciona savignyi TaxID=51511 RepID=H2ZJK1_CIOSA